VKQEYSQNQVPHHSIVADELAKINDQKVHHENLFLYLQTTFYKPSRKPALRFEAIVEFNVSLSS